VDQKLEISVPSLPPPLLFDKIINICCYAHKLCGGKMTENFILSSSSVNLLRKYKRCFKLFVINKNLPGVTMTVPGSGASENSLDGAGKLQHHI
jgi:hypothetical protein